MLMPARRRLYQQKLGFYLFLVSLGIFFFASMMAYAVIRTKVVKPTDHQLTIPVSFWLSTIVLLTISFALHMAVESVHAEFQKRFRQWIAVAFGLSFVFFILQSQGLSSLISTHLKWVSGEAKLYGVSFTLALLHALHVFGGLIYLWIVAARAFKGRYDHEHHGPVDMCASYWHFLDGVWVIMLATFWLTA